MNAGEGFFGKLARRRRGVYDSIREFKASIRDFIELHNGNEEKAFKWTASPENAHAPPAKEGFKQLE